MVTINTTVVRGTWKSAASCVLEPDRTPADTLTTKGSVFRTSEMNNFLLVDQLCGLAASRGSHSTRSLSNSMLVSGEGVLWKGSQRKCERDGALNFSKAGVPSALQPQAAFAISLFTAMIQGAPRRTGQK